MKTVSQPLWTRIIRNVWSRSFYSAPFVVPLLTLIVLWLLRRRELDHRAMIIAWACGAPTGFLLWVAAWKFYGAGTGQITLTVATTASLGWIVWHSGLYTAVVRHKWRAGIGGGVFSLIAMILIAATIGRGTAPIKLAVMAAIAGAVLLLCDVVITNADRVSKFCLHHWVTPAWQFLNQPVRCAATRPNEENKPTATTVS